MSRQRTRPPQSLPPNPRSPNPTAMKLPAFLLCLLLLANVSSSIAFTFSSKLIHRFSEEAKAIRVSRGGEVFGMWPKRKSVEYYELLVSRDLERQKMKVGGKGEEVLFPSKGSEVLELGNDFGWLHYTWIDIGTPNASFLVALDSGSDLFWLPCNCIDCAPLSASNYGNLDRDLSEYNPSKSSTSKHLSCSHEFCELGPNCKSPKQPCPYIMKYMSENTTSSGFLVEDTIHLAAHSDQSSKSLVHARVIIGCGRQQSGSYLDGAAPDGVMGLGLGDASVPSVLARAGLMRNSFSMCFGEDDSGRIFFGDKGAAAQQSTIFLPLNGNYVKYFIETDVICVGSSCLKQSGFKAEFDSGTSFTLLPEKVYQKVVVEFDRRMNVSRSSYEGTPWDYCYEASSQDLPKIPTMTLMFAHNNSFVVHNPIFLIYDDQDVTGFCLALTSIAGDYGIIGQNYMTGYRLVFDRENLKLHWSPSNCEDLSDGQTETPTPPSTDRPQAPLNPNARQTPGGQAVAPAVAGKTPVRSLATSISQFHMSRLLQLLLALPLLVI